MKNGNLKLVAVMASAGYVAGVIASRSRKKIELISNIDNRKYVNRLKEFYFDDEYKQSVKRYYKFVESGLSGESAFKVTIASVKLTHMPIGEFND